MGIYEAFMWQMQMKRLTTTMSPASTPPTTNGTVSLLAASVCFFSSMIRYWESVKENTYCTVLKLDPPPPPFPLALTVKYTFNMPFQSWLENC